MERKTRTPFSRALVAPLLAIAVAACGNELPPASAFMRVPVGTSPVQGPATAWVTVVEFADFQCPYCAAVAPTLAAMQAQFGTDVRLVYKHFPLSFHARARPAAVAAVCAQAQGRFWEFHDVVYANQDSLMRVADFESALAQLATAAGLELVAWQSCRADPASDAAVSADVSLGMQVGVRATPTSVVNGVPLEGALSASAFRAAIEAARSAAKASGIPADQYYDKAVLGL